jgi:hypothetical protein
MSNPEILTAASRILSDDGPAAMGQLVKATFEQIIQGTESAWRSAHPGSSVDEPDIDAAVAAFLQVKYRGFELGEDENVEDAEAETKRWRRVVEFLNKVVNANDCGAFIYIAARNFAVDLYRRNPLQMTYYGDDPRKQGTDAAHGGDEDAGPPCESGARSLGSTDADPDVDEDAGNARKPDMFAALDQWERIQLKVAHTEPLTGEEEHELARRRGKTLEQVQRDLRRRESSVESNIERSRIDADRRYDYHIQRYRTRVRLRDRFEAKLRERTGSTYPVGNWTEPPDPIDNEEYRQFTQSLPTFIAAPAMRQRAFLHRLQLSIDKAESNARKALQQARQNQPNYLDIARILGEVEIGASEIENCRAANTVGTRLRRLEKKLKRHLLQNETN